MDSWRKNLRNKEKWILDLPTWPLLDWLLGFQLNYLYFLCHFWWRKCSKHSVPQWWSDSKALILHPEVMIHVIFLQKQTHPLLELTKITTLVNTHSKNFKVNHWCMPALITLTNFLINDQAKLHPATNLLGTRGIYLWGWL